MTTFPINSEVIHELREMIPVANKSGCYDAADFLSNLSENLADQFPWTKGLRDLASLIPSRPQAQYSLNQQLSQLIPVANEIGLSLASTYFKKVATL